MINFNQYKALTFDCYGTLIDWENGILGVLKPLLLAHNTNLDDDQILEMFAEFEAELEIGDYIKYREVLKRVVHKFGERFGFEPTIEEISEIILRNNYSVPSTVSMRICCYKTKQELQHRLILP